MKVNIKMAVEVNDKTRDGRPIEAWEVESHIKDALTSWTGNDVEFYAVEVFECEEKEA